MFVLNTLLMYTIWNVKNVLADEHLPRLMYAIVYC